VARALRLERPPRLERPGRARRRPVRRTSAPRRIAARRPVRARRTHARRTHARRTHARRTHAQTVRVRLVRVRLVRVRLVRVRRAHAQTVRVRLVRARPVLDSRQHGRPRRDAAAPTRRFPPARVQRRGRLVRAPAPAAVHHRAARIQLHAPLLTAERLIVALLIALRMARRGPLRPARHPVRACALRRPQVLRLRLSDRPAHPLAPLPGGSSVPPTRNARRPGARPVRIRGRARRARWQVVTARRSPTAAPAPIGAPNPIGTLDRTVKQHRTERDPRLALRLASSEACVVQQRSIL
jgi:hypothetical protein